MSLARTGPFPLINEDSYDASDIYPSRVGTVSETDTESGEDTDGNDVTFYNFYDSSVPANLNFEDCLIAGQTMTVISRQAVWRAVSST